MQWINQYFTVLVFGNDREPVNALKQGESVHITGRLQWREYAPEDGPKKEYVEIVADSISTTLPEPNKQEELATEEETW
jgi:single-stranded DNA-binding protein